MPLESIAPEAGAAVETPVRATWLLRLGDAVLSTDPRRRIRTIQWLICVLVYVPCAVVVWFSTDQGWQDGVRVISWCGFVAAGLISAYVAIRSGWSERFDDPALTAAQIVLGVVAVEWGYLICAPEVRGVTLVPLLLIFTFGAFSLNWQRIVWLTVFALASLVAVVLVLHAMRIGSSWSFDDTDLRIDLINVTMVVILLPAISLVAARLSALRSRLRSQRVQLTQALREVQRLATRDDLTGLANRRYMQERLAQEHSRSCRKGYPFSVAVIDLDHFKRVNDLYGHARGDQVLRAFADGASSCLRTSDLLARWGGEEFLLLLPDTSAEQAMVSIERLLVQIRVLPLDVRLPVTFSAGVTEYRTGEPVTETVARADRTMYAAKQSGRNKALLE